MSVLVADTSVLIDLERGALLRTCFGLPFEFSVPDLLYRKELEEHGGPSLIELGLRVVELGKDGVVLAQDYWQAQRSLSLPDSFALALEKLNCWTLMSGDGRLRELAASEGVQCHGALWLMDQVFEQGLASGGHLRTSLHAITSHPRCRLPVQEVRKRLSRYSRT